MKANQTMCALAIAKARELGPRIFEINGTKCIAIHLTAEEVIDLHHAEGFESMKTIEKRVKLWTKMPEVYGITGLGDLIVLADDYESCVAIENMCERTLCSKTMGCPRLEGAA